jgi:GTP-binding protein Era
MVKSEGWEVKTSQKKKAEKKSALKVGYVALVGRPNVGKSTLLNSLLGQKITIISDKPQTTRISILGIKTTEKGQIIFIDNPGIHKPLHGLNRRMMNFVYSSLETADLICLLIDAKERFGHGDEFVLETLKKITTPLFLLINKVDIVRKENILLLIDKYKDLLPFKEIIPISAVKGTNLDVLEREIFRYLPEAEKLFGDDEISDQSERFLLAEIIREKMLSHVEQELPFVTAVYIEKIEKREPYKVAEGAREAGAEPDVRTTQSAEAAGAIITGAGEKAVPQAEGGAAREARSEAKKPEKKRRPVTYIGASIFVEKDNHRKIIIGRHGQLVKMIGTEARREIEEILETKVYLDLEVKVRERWRDSPDVLDLIEGQK